MKLDIKRIIINAIPVVVGLIMWEIAGPFIRPLLAKLPFFGE